MDTTSTTEILVDVLETACTNWENGRLSQREYFTITRDVSKLLKKYFKEQYASAIKVII